MPALEPQSQNNNQNNNNDNEGKDDEDIENPTKTQNTVNTHTSNTQETREVTPQPDNFPTIFHYFFAMAESYNFDNDKIVDLFQLPDDPAAWRPFNGLLHENDPIKSLQVENANFPIIVGSNVRFELKNTTDNTSNERYNGTIETLQGRHCDNPNTQFKHCKAITLSYYKNNNHLKKCYIILKPLIDNFYFINMIQKLLYQRC